MTPQLISVQDVAFRGRPLSLLVAYDPAGSHLFRFSRRSLCLALQSTARRNETHESYLHNKKAERIGFSTENRTRSDLPLTNIRSYKPLFYHYILVIKIVVPVSSAKSFMKTRIAYRMIMIPRKVFRTRTARSFKFFISFLNTSCILFVSSSRTRSQ